MIETSTQTDLIRLLYAETSIDESSEIIHHIAEDAELVGLNKDFQTVRAHLDTLSYSASTESLNKILEHARR